MTERASGALYEDGHRDMQIPSSSIGHFPEGSELRMGSAYA